MTSKPTPPDPSAAHAVTGIGYEGTSAAELIDRLNRQGITMVVDVRLNPISRKRGLSKTALSEALTEAGIGYTHLRALGNPKENRAGFAHPGSERDRAVARFRALLQQPAAQAAVDQIRGLAQTERIALLCFEADPASCHRQVILDSLRP